MSEVLILRSDEPNTPLRFSTNQEAISFAETFNNKKIAQYGNSVDAWRTDPESSEAYIVANNPLRFASPPTRCLTPAMLVGVAEIAPSTISAINQMLGNTLSALGVVDVAKTQKAIAARLEVVASTGHKPPINTPAKAVTKNRPDRGVTM